MVSKNYVDINKSFLKSEIFFNIYIYFFYLRAVFSSSVLDFYYLNDTFSVFLKNKKYFLLVMYFLKKSSYSKFESLLDIACVDLIHSNHRFLLRYELISICFNFRFNLFFFVNELQNVITLSTIFPNAVSIEREIWDMYGIFFDKNPDLRRILTDYGFQGFPLRKDFPLSGFLELFYDEMLQNFSYLPVSLAQEYRNFKFSNPWIK